MHIIYFNNKPLYLVTKISGEIEDYLHQKETLFIDELNEHTVRTMISELQQPQFYRGVFLHSNVDELLYAFKQHFTVIQAGGGLIYTDDGYVLLIFRRGKWDMPKGKLDEGETIEACALREVQEETGISKVALVKPITITYHTYHENDAYILKESHWFFMKAASKENLTPQTEEDIEKCEWVSFTNLTPYIDNMHASVKDVLTKGIQQWENK